MPITITKVLVLGFLELREMSLAPLEIPVDSDQLAPLKIPLDIDPQEAVEQSGRFLQHAQEMLDSHGHCLTSEQQEHYACTLDELSEDLAQATRTEAIDVYHQITETLGNLEASINYSPYMVQQAKEVVRERIESLKEDYPEVMQQRDMQLDVAHVLSSLEEGTIDYAYTILQIGDQIATEVMGRAHKAAELERMASYETNYVAEPLEFLSDLPVESELSPEEEAALVQSERVLDAISRALDAQQVRIDLSQASEYAGKVEELQAELAAYPRPGSSFVPLAELRESIKELALLTQGHRIDTREQAECHLFIVSVTVELNAEFLGDDRVQYYEQCVSYLAEKLSDAVQNDDHVAAVEFRRGAKAVGLNLAEELDYSPSRIKEVTADTRDKIAELQETYPEIMTDERVKSYLLDMEGAFIFNKYSSGREIQRAFDGLDFLVQDIHRERAG
jgi:hypothetical protein